MYRSIKYSPVTVCEPAFVTKKSTTRSDFLVNGPPFGLRTLTGCQLPKYGCKSALPVSEAIGVSNGVEGSGNEVAVGVGCRSSVSDTVNAVTTPSGSTPKSSTGRGVEVGSGVAVGVGVLGTSVAVGGAIVGAAVGIGVGDGRIVGVGELGAGTLVTVGGTVLGDGSGEEEAVLPTAGVSITSTTVVLLLVQPANATRAIAARTIAIFRTIFAV